MRRVLDIDLDFFVHKMCTGGTLTVRPSDRTSSVANRGRAGILTERCGLSRAMPGFFTRTMAKCSPRNVPVAHTLVGLPVQVTHVDAHANFGLSIEIAFPRANSSRRRRHEPMGLSSASA